MSTDGDSTLSNTIDKLVPVTSDGIPIIWTDDNDAHIEGASEEGQAKSCAISEINAPLRSLDSTPFQGSYFGNFADMF